MAPAIRVQNISKCFTLGRTGLPLSNITERAGMMARDTLRKVKNLLRPGGPATDNVYWAGLTVYPGALIINKRFANVAPGAPIFMYNWAEDNIIRERVFVPKDKQSKNELFPDTLPSKPGSAPGEGLVK